MRPQLATVLTLSVLLATSGCSVITRTRRAAGFISPATSHVVEDGYDDYVGVIHVHTTYSHDAHGTFENVVRVANAQNLDYVIITEHNTLKPLYDGREGWHGAVLILIGMEISGRDGHYLALNITEEIDQEQYTMQELIDEVIRQGGFGFIAHPYFDNHRWTNWDVSRFTGIEIYNVAHDTLDENKLRLALWTLTATADSFYYSLIDRPYDPLAKWDELTRRHGRVTGIGAIDAHEFHFAGFRFAPYDVMFQLVRTHVLIPQGEEMTKDTVYTALREGHAYTGIELLAEAKGFQFVAEDGTHVLGIMGDEVVLTPDLVLTAILPSPAELTLFRNGAEFDSTISQTWHVPVTVPGIYRLEAVRHDKPWIISNPIYVLPPDTE